jgi:hypothetical protein
MELADRSGALPNLESRQAVEHGIEVGRGGMFLSLSDEQYLN